MSEFDIHDVINLHLDLVDSIPSTTAEEWYSQLLAFICDARASLTPEQFDQLNRLVVTAVRPLLLREIGDSGKKAAAVLATKVALH